MKSARPKIDLWKLKLWEGKATAESNADTFTRRYQGKEVYRELFSKVDFKILRIPAFVAIEDTMGLLNYTAKQWRYDVEGLERNIEMELKVANLEIDKAGLDAITDEKLPNQGADTLLLLCQGIHHNIKATVEESGYIYPEEFDAVYRDFYSEVTRDGIKEVVGSVRAGIRRLEGERLPVTGSRAEGARASLPDVARGASGQEGDVAELAPGITPSAPPLTRTSPRGGQAALAPGTKSQLPG